MNNLSGKFEVTPELFKLIKFDTFRQVRNDLARQALSQKEGLIREQITRYLGHDKFTPRDLVGRCRIDILQHSNVETYYIDDVPLIEIYPLVFTQNDEGLSTMLKANFDYRVLLRDEQCRT